MLILTIRKTVTSQYYVSIRDDQGKTLLTTPMCTSKSACSATIEKIRRRQTWNDYMQYRENPLQQHYIVLVDECRQILAFSPEFEDIANLHESVTTLMQSLAYAKLEDITGESIGV